MSPDRLRTALIAAQIVSIATLFRSVVYERWITVLASLLLLAGASAALRGRTWGIGVSLAAATAFPAAWLLGIAPPWFALVGWIGALPFMLSLRAMAQFDKGATALGAALAGVGAIGSAITFKAAAPWLFSTFPSLRPSWEAANFGPALIITTVALGLTITSRPKRAALASSSAGVHTGSAGAASEVSRVRVAPPAQAPVELGLETHDERDAENEADDEASDGRREVRRA
jgi:hypothetical protein